MAFHSPPAHACTHLTAEALSRLEALLLSELELQTARGAESGAALIALDGQTDVDSAFEREVAEVTAGQADAAVRDVRHALDRITEGTYGSCEACGKAVPFERLEAIPHARRCVACPAQRSGLLG